MAWRDRTVRIVEQEQGRSLLRTEGLVRGCIWVDTKGQGWGVLRTLLFPISEWRPRWHLKGIPGL